MWAGDKRDVGREKDAGIAGARASEEFSTALFTVWCHESVKRDRGARKGQSLVILPSRQGLVESSGMALGVGGLLIYSATNRRISVTITLPELEHKRQRRAGPVAADAPSAET